MIPSSFQISISGEGQNPVPVKITIGPGVIMVCILFAVIMLLKSRKK